jgi:hypothetical protein
MDTRSDVRVLIILRLSLIDKPQTALHPRTEAWATALPVLVYHMDRRSVVAAGTASEPGTNTQPFPHPGSAEPPAGRACVRDPVRATLDKQPLNQHELHMDTLRTISKRDKTLGIVLIVIVGMLNFHLPHFLLESTTYFSDATYLLEFALLVNLLGAVVAAVGIYRNLRWGWLLGILIVAISFVLYLAQETVGLPGLPKVWWEPSRIVSLIVEALFVVLVRYNQIV